MSKSILLTFLLSLLIGCSAEIGTLEFRANGEDFVRQGFIAKDGWAVQFDNVIVELSNVTALQTDPPFDPKSGAEPEGTAVVLGKALVVDLAEGDADAEPIVIGSIDADVGQYNAIRWDMRNESVRLVGSAEKDGNTVDFDLRFDQPLSYACGEYVGDGRKGFVNADSTGNIEMTFHFDHMFGDIEVAADEALNTGALGFAPLAAIATDGVLDMGQAELAAALDDADFTTLLDTLTTLGHVGEGHCFESTGGFTERSAE
ncbi:MAG: DUF4382 domain-containing protein [Candidatus Promineifilaceae bacterium]